VTNAVTNAVTHAATTGVTQRVTRDGTGRVGTGALEATTHLEKQEARTKTDAATARPLFRVPVWGSGTAGVWWLRGGAGPTASARRSRRRDHRVTSAALTCAFAMPSAYVIRWSGGVR